MVLIQILQLRILIPGVSERSSSGPGTGHQDLLAGKENKPAKRKTSPIGDGNKKTVKKNKPPPPQSTGRELRPRAKKNAH